MALIEDLKQSVIEREVAEAVELTQKAIDGGLSAEEVLTKALIPAMSVVGGRYESGEIFVPEMLLSAQAMKKAMEILQPLLAESEVEPKGVAIIGTVEGDLHDIGQNLVATMLEGAGFKVFNLGTDVSAGRFAEATKEHQADLVGMSALLTTTLVRMPEVIEALVKNGLRDRVKTMVGGAPLTHEYALKIGADGFAPDAASAVKLAERLMAKE